MSETADVPFEAKITLDIKNNEFSLSDGRIAFFNHKEWRWYAMKPPYDRSTAVAMPRDWAPLGRKMHVD